MSDKGRNILKSVVFFIIALTCLSINIMGNSEEAGDAFVYIGAGLGLFLGLAYLKKAFDL